MAFFNAIQTTKKAAKYVNGAAGRIFIFIHGSFDAERTALLISSESNKLSSPRSSITRQIT
jgi:hypothetical protein